MLDMNNPDIIKFRAEYDTLCKWKKEEEQKIKEQYEKDYSPEIRARAKDLLASLQHPVHKEWVRRWKALQQKYNYLYSKEEKQAE